MTAPQQHGRTVTDGEAWRSLTGAGKGIAAARRAQRAAASSARAADGKPVNECRNPNGRRGNAHEAVCPWRWIGPRTAEHTERGETLTVGVVSAALTSADGSTTTTRIKRGEQWRDVDVVVVALAWAGWEAP